MVLWNSWKQPPYKSYRVCVPSSWHLLMKNVRFLCFILECSGKDWNQSSWSEKHVVLRTRLWWSAKCPIFQLCPYRPGTHLWEFAISSSLSSLGSAGDTPGMGVMHLLGCTHEGSLCSQKCPSSEPSMFNHEPLLSFLRVPPVLFRSAGSPSRPAALHIPSVLLRAHPWGWERHLGLPSSALCDFAEEVLSGHTQTSSTKAGGRKGKQRKLSAQCKKHHLLQLWDKNPSAWVVWTTRSVGKSGLTTTRLKKAS